MASISSLSTEYVKCQVDFTVGGVVTDPTVDTVQMAFVVPGTDPITGDWVAGSWESDLTTPLHPVRYARALVGPSSGGKLLAKGTYAVWVKITDNPEIPAKTAGILEVD